MSLVSRVLGSVLSLSGLLLGSGSALASEYSESWGPAVGSIPPLLEAPDQTGAMRSLLREVSLRSTRSLRFRPGAQETTVHAKHASSTQQSSSRMNLPRRF